MAGRAPEVAGRPVDDIRISIIDPVAAVRSAGCRHLIRTTK